MLKYMLDTNIVIYTIKNRPEAVRKVFNLHEGQMCISSITWGELVFGAERSSQPERNLADIEAMAARLMIAGHARSMGLTLVTNNLREFERVPGLRVANWL